MKPTFDEIAGLETETQRSVYRTWMGEAKKRIRYGALLCAVGFVMVGFANGTAAWFGPVKLLGEAFFIGGCIGLVGGYRNYSALTAMAKTHPNIRE